MSNRDAILEVLNSNLFDKVRDDARASLLAWAKGRLAKYQEKTAAFVPTGVKRDDAETMASFSLGEVGLWTNRNEVIKSHPSSYYITLVNEVEFNRTDSIAIQKAAAPLIVLNEKRVIDESDRRWDETKRFYAFRVGEKIDEVLGENAVITLNVEREYTLVGQAKAVLGEKELVLSTSMKINYRYGENAANRDMTIYRQVPTLIVSAKGFDVQARLNEIDRLSKQAKLDKKETLERLGKELRDLEKRKRKVDDLHSSINYCAKYCGGLPLTNNLDSAKKEWAALGGAEQPLPTLIESRMLVKEIREKVKAAKQAIRTFRENFKKETVDA